MTNDSEHEDPPSNEDCSNSEDQASSDENAEENEPDDAGVEGLPVVVEAERILTEAAARVAAPSMELLQAMSDALTGNRVLHKMRGDRLLIGFAADRAGAPGFRVQVRMMPSNTDVIIVDFRADRTGSGKDTETTEETSNQLKIGLLQFANTWNRSHRWPAVVVEHRNAADSDPSPAPQASAYLAAKYSMIANLESSLSVEQTMMMFIRTVRDLFRRAHASGY